MNELVFKGFVEDRKICRFRRWDETRDAKNNHENTVTTPRSAHYLPSKISLTETEIREETKSKEKKARMNLTTLYPVVIKLNFTLSSKYDNYYTKGRTQEEKGEKIH